MRRARVAHADRLGLGVIPFAEWRREIAPLWLAQGAVAWIPPVLNGHGQLRYAGTELLRRVLLFPVAAELDGRRIGWTSVYNLSDEAVRVRGIYVLPEFRAMGVGRRLVAFATGLWPSPWRSCLIYARSANVALYERWGFAPVPGHHERPSDLARILPDLTVQLMARPMPPADATSPGPATAQFEGIPASP